MDKLPPVDLHGMKRMEKWLWFLLLAVVIVTRFHDLETRAMSHDESLHAFYSWQYARNGEYIHNPMMHGPLLFHLNAAVFNVLGDTDWTARLIPVLAGIALIACFIPFRRWLGPGGALCGAALTAFSADILFYSRYIRNDIYICLLLMLWVYALFRYLEEPAARWLILQSTVIALSFACKEVSFIHIAMLAAFLLLRLGVHGIRARSLDIAAMDALIFMGALTVPFACPLLHELLGWDPLDNQTAEGQNRTYQLAGGLAGAAFCLSAAWLFLRNRFIPGKTGHTRQTFIAQAVTWSLSAMLFWAITLALFTSLFTNTKPGLATGLAGSLGYWLSQHSVQRGNQPGYYYLMLLLLYNPGLLLAACAGTISLARQALARRLSPPAAKFLPFVLFWMLANAAAYTIAGERMPWLLVHISLPMCLLGGWWLFECCAAFPWKSGPLNYRLPILLIPPLLFYLLLHWPEFPVGGAIRDIPTVQNDMRAVRAATAILAMVLLLLCSLRRAGVSRGRAFLLGTAATLLLFGLHASLRLTYLNYDLATEHLVFAHGTDRIKPLMRMIDQLQEQQGESPRPVVAFDQHSAWPLTWYLRNTPNRFFLTPDASLAGIPVILAGNPNTTQLRSILGANHTLTTFPIVWWPLQGYMHLTGQRLRETIACPETRRTLRNIILHRQYNAPPDQWPLRHDVNLFLHTSLAAETPGNPPPREADRLAIRPALFGPYMPRLPVAVMAGPYNGIPLHFPRAIARTPEGKTAIADTGNNRVILLATDGTLLAALSPDPPLDEPWGVAANNQTIFVADTWHGKIRRFNWQGHEIQPPHGRFAIAADYDRNPHLLYGPRGLDLAPDGRLLAADTGNKRVLIFDADGSFNGAIGLLNEPVNAVHLPGSRDIAIADAWNRRILIVQPDGTEPRTLRAPFWNYRDTPFKPFIAADRQHRLYATVPDKSCIVVLDPNGTPLYHFGLYGFTQDRMSQPTGLFMDHHAGQLLVADSANNRILVFQLDSP